jgi:hypothetical protein
MGLQVCTTCPWFTMLRLESKNQYFKYDPLRVCWVLPTTQHGWETTGGVGEPPRHLALYTSFAGNRSAGVKEQRMGFHTPSPVGLKGMSSLPPKWGVEGLCSPDPPFQSEVCWGAHLSSRKPLPYPLLLSAWCLRLDSTMVEGRAKGESQEEERGTTGRPDGFPLSYPSQGPQPSLLAFRMFPKVYSFCHFDSNKGVLRLLQSPVKGVK